MGKRIYVGNLARGVTDGDLIELFGQYGRVLMAQVIGNREDGRASGFGVVEMENDQEAENAIHALNGAMHRNVGLAVSLARPRDESPLHRNGSHDGNSAPRGDHWDGGCSGTDHPAEKLPPEFLEWARQQYTDEEILAGVREVRETGGLELKDFIQEIDDILSPND